MKSLKNYIMESGNAATLVCVAVKNSANIERHTFDNIYDDVNAICKELSKLKDSEYELYQYKNSFDACAEDADILNDWDDDVMDTMEWSKKDYKENLTYYSKLLKKDSSTFDKFVINNWFVALNASYDEVKKLLNK